MEHAQSEASPRQGLTLTQQIFVGLAVGIVAGWFVSESHPGAAPLFRPFSLIFLRLIKMIIAPLIFSTLVAGIAGAGHFKVVGRMGLRAIIYFEVVVTLALVIGLMAVNVMQPGGWRQPAHGPAVGDHRHPANLGPDSAARRARIGHPGDGRRGRASARRLQHLLRHRAGHNQQEGYVLLLLVYWFSWCLL